jgi:hypothetical protein
MRARLAARFSAAERELQSTILSELRIISVHIRGEWVDLRKVEFEFELDFLVVNPREIRRENS